MLFASIQRRFKRSVWNSPGEWFFWPKLPGIVAAWALIFGGGTGLACAGLPPGWTDGDIGSPALAGSASYTNGYWTITGGGTDIWGTNDQFNFASTGLNGDGMIISRVLGQTGANASSKSGVMIRATADAGSTEVAVFLTPGSGVTFQYRSNINGQSAQVDIAGIAAPAWVRLSRLGNNFTGSYSTDGINWTNLGTTQSVPMSTAVLAGLCACPHDNTTNNTATINCALVTAGPQVAEPASITREVFVGETTWPFPKVPVGTNQMLPPMGWSFWNAFAGACDDQLTRQTVSALVSTGLRDAGYSYVLAFDGEWLTTRVPNGHDANGNIIIDTSIWPNGIQSVCDDIHTNGFKVAGYSDIGVTGYGSPPEWGSLNYYQQDVNQFARWGWDYLKIDDHGPGDFFAASRAIANNDSGRPMVLSFSTPQTYAFDFGPRICNMWRVGNDITLNLGNVTWSNILREFNSDDTYWSAQAPGTWPDLDMLAVGLYGISDTEGRSHFNMWCIRGAPLIIGTDVRWSTNASPAALGPPLSAATLTTLSNPEVIAVDQDPLDACGVKVATGIYAKPLGTFTSGSYAVLILNMNSSATAFTLNWSNLGLQAGGATVRDLWAHQNLGTFTNSYTSPSLASHDSMMLIVTGNFDWSRPRTYEAEWAFNTFQGNAYTVSEAAGFSNGGYAAGVGSGTSNTMQFNQVASPSNSLWQANIYYASATAETAQLSLNGGAPITVSFPATGSGTTVASLPLYLPLATGTNTLLFSNASAPVPNLDKLVVALSAPTGVGVANPQNAVNGTLTLTWNALPGTISYNVYRGTTSGGENPIPIATALTSATFTDTNLIIDRTYYYIVTATNTVLGGESPPSTEASVASRPAATSFAYENAVTSAIPTAFWRLNETAGTTAYDSIGGYNGTYGAGVALGMVGPRPPTNLGFEMTNTAAAMTNGVNNSWATMPALNLNTNTVTITCWINPAATQAPYAGLVYYRSGSTVAGMDFGSAPTLGYTWNNDSNTYGWGSGLQPPAGVWSLAVLVVQPNEAIIYLGTTNGVVSATNVYTHVIQAFGGTGTIGTDTYSATARAYTGGIDEVAVYNYALSPTQIQQLYANGFRLPQVTLNVQPNGGGSMLTWPQGALLEADQLTGPWTQVTGAISPFMVAPASAQKFFRVQME